MLASQDLVAFVATTDPARSRVFYEDVLGMTLESESESGHSVTGV